MKPKRHGTSAFGKSEIDGGVAWYLFERASYWEVLRWMKEHCTPWEGRVGQIFWNVPHIRQVHDRILVTQSWGYDV